MDDRPVIREDLVPFDRRLEKLEAQLDKLDGKIDGLNSGQSAIILQLAQSFAERDRRQAKQDQEEIQQTAPMKVHVYLLWGIAGTIGGAILMFALTRLLKNLFP